MAWLRLGIVEELAQRGAGGLLEVASTASVSEAGASVESYSCIEGIPCTG
jgi:hypothetical protein